MLTAYLTAEQQSGALKEILDDTKTAHVIARSLLSCPDEGSSIALRKVQVHRL